MGHNDYVSTLYGEWPDTIVPTPEALRELDQLSSESVNGDEGGSWNPEEPIGIGGQGFSFSAGSVSGPVSTGRRSNGLILGDNDYPGWAAPLTRSFLVPLRDFATRYDYQGPEPSDNETAGQHPYWMSAATAPGTIANPATTLGAFFTVHNRSTRLVCPIPSYRLIQGASITGLSLRLRIGGLPPYGTIPDALPGFRLVRIPRTGIYSNATSELIHLATWQAGHTYAIGDVVIPASPNSRQFRATVGGVSGGGEPAGFAAAAYGSTVAGDGGVSWRCEYGPANAYGHYARLVRPATSDALYAGGAPQEILVDSAARGLNASTNVIDVSVNGYQYVLEIYDATPRQALIALPNRYHSFRVTMGNITELRNTY